MDQAKEMAKIAFEALEDKKVRSCCFGWGKTRV